MNSFSMFVYRRRKKLKMESQEKPNNQARYFHWSKYSNEQIEEFIKEAIEKQDEDLAKMWRYILYLKLLNLKTYDTVSS
ncbi:MAG: hypothetical protein EZS28_043480 [Streblomastix strix]|uniref:Uncharacterized protein n=1 Tax=Streblomastix strix TaxID=222440 RepID=A0A5J4TSW7_9EUKA|nr:MAG: hypothetical protein EZS28_043480 [Streblomastix strix]